MAINYESLRAFQPELTMRSLLLLPLLLLLLGCQSAYKTTGVTIVTVDAAMNAWGDYVRAGLSTPEEEAKVKSAYDKYYAAIQGEKAAVIAYKSTGDTNGLNNALIAVQSATPAVVALIFEFLPPGDTARLKGLNR